MKLIDPVFQLKNKWNAFVKKCAPFTRVRINVFFCSIGKGLSCRIKKLLRKVGIFPRLIISFLILLLFAALFLTFFSFHQYSREINTNINHYTSLLVQNVSLKIEDKMKEYEDIALRFYNDAQVLQAISENSGLSGKTISPAQYDQNTFLIENKLYNMRLNRKYIVNIQFVTPDRQYRMVEQNGFRRGGTIRDLEAFYDSDFYLLPQEKNGYPIWIDGHNQSGIFYRDEQNVYGFGNIITMAVAVYEPAGRDFLGVLLFNIDLNAFSDSIKDYRSYAYEGGNTFLVGEDGVLSWYSPSITAPSFPQDSRLFARMLSGDQDVLHTKINHQPVLLAYQRVKDTGLFVSYIADLNVLLKNSYQIRNLCLIVLIFTVIACFIIAYYVTVSISDPVQQLIRVMHKTADGKWTARYENSGHDEITILGDNFNAMAEKTNQLIDQVYLSEIRRQRMLLSWKNAQLSAMLMQINPHFLYNTLDIIRWEAMYEANGESRVTKMIEKFSRLCRMTMRTGSNTIPLRDGIEHASTYLEVINFRHADKISLEIITDDDTQDLYIPQFMLQPIMENAVVHAFGDASSGYGIHIHSFRKDAVLHILVADNGRGMTPEELESLRSALSQEETPDTLEKGIGLVNVHQRIRLFYGEKYGVDISSTPGVGTRIEITIPVRTQSENMENSTGGFKQP